MTARWVITEATGVDWDELLDTTDVVGALKAAAGGGRYVVIDTEANGGDGAVYGLEHLGVAVRDDGLAWVVVDGPLYRLVDPTSVSGFGPERRSPGLAAPGQGIGPDEGSETTRVEFAQGVQSEGEDA